MQLALAAFQRRLAITSDPMPCQRCLLLLKQLRLAKVQLQQLTISMLPSSSSSIPASTATISSASAQVVIPSMPSSSLFDSPKPQSGAITVVHPSSSFPFTPTPLNPPPAAASSAAGPSSNVPLPSIPMSAPSAMDRQRSRSRSRSDQKITTTKKKKKDKQKSSTTKHRSTSKSRHSSSSSRRGRNRAAQSDDSSSSDSDRISNRSRTPSPSPWPSPSFLSSSSSLFDDIPTREHSSSEPPQLHTHHKWQSHHSNSGPVRGGLWLRPSQPLSSTTITPHSMHTIINTTTPEIVIDEAHNESHVVIPSSTAVILSTGSPLPARRRHSQTISMPTSTSVSPPSSSPLVATLPRNHHQTITSSASSLFLDHDFL
jgi:hypothetical protein